MDFAEQNDIGRFIYAIHCLDDLSCGMVDNGARFGGSVKRIGNYAEHRAYMMETSDPNSPKYIKKVAAGPMESDDGKYMIGSLFLVECTRAEAEKFNREDPFTEGKVWEKVTITRYISPIGINEVNAEVLGTDRATTRMLVKERSSL
eukprot:gene4879-6836_t